MSEQQYDIEDERWQRWHQKIVEAKLPEAYATEGVPSRAKWIKLRVFAPGTIAEWLLCEYEPDSQRAFAWCDLGLGLGEWGWVWMPEVAALDIERADGVRLHAQFDDNFEPCAFGDLGRA
ncbi:DUF2958 domain-containing protein [Microbacterium sp. GXF6406]